MSPVATMPASGVAWLFAPGHRPDRFDKASSSGADNVILDLEDSVAPAAKAAARREVAAWLSGSGVAWARISAAGTEWFEEDLHALRSAPGLRGIVLPKAESPEVVLRVRESIGAGRGLVALIETARGVQRAADLAESGRVDRLALGSIDLALDLGAVESDESLLLARSTLVLASRAAGLLGPIDGVTVVVDDPAAVTAAVVRARRLGFAAKLCVHPRQVALVSAAFAPSAQELAWAARVDAAARARQDGGSAFALDGQMVDRPVLLKAQDILARGSLTEPI